MVYYNFLQSGGFGYMVYYNFLQKGVSGVSRRLRLYIFLIQQSLSA